MARNVARTGGRDDSDREHKQRCRDGEDAVAEGFDARCPDLFHRSRHKFGRRR
jgi:hypothetical protein